jgi:ribonucleotide reductase beta subunit family protein with ferritin-like domain
MATATSPETPDAGVASLPADAISYEDLYFRWERGHWSATELDFTEDARQWREDFTEFERTAAVWNYCLFFWGEDAVADNLSPYIDAAPREEQKYFLATQQVDEARHAVFCRRCAASATAPWPAACRRSSRSSPPGFARSSTAWT